MVTTNITDFVGFSISSTILPEDYFFWTMYGVIGVGILVGNSFTLTVFLSNYNLRHTYMNIFLVSLAGSDIMMAVSVLPGFASFCSKKSWRKDKKCHILEGPKDFVFLLSIFNLLAITYDRYLAVLKPLHYHRTLTRAKLTAILLAVWIVPLPLTLMRIIIQVGYPNVLSIYDSIFVSFVVFLPIMIMLAVNIKIVKAIRHHSIKINVKAGSSEVVFSENSEMNSGLSSSSHPESRAVTPFDTPTTPSKHSVLPRTPNTASDLPRTPNYELLKVPGTYVFKNKRHSFKMFRGNNERKGTVTCLLIVLAFVVFWLPRAFYNFFDTFNLRCLNSETFVKASYLCLFAQSLVNPFIYSFYRKDFRIAAKKLLSC